MHAVLQTAFAAASVLSSYTVHVCCAGHVIELATSRSVTTEHVRSQQVVDLQAELQARLGPAPAASGTLHDILAS